MSSNPAFAFVVNSILNNNKSVKILSKAKKENTTTTITSKDENKVDLVDKCGNVIIEDQIKNKKNTVSSNKKILNRNKIDSMCLSKIENEDKEKEKILKLIATKGVVQLFNVVREKQKLLKRKLDEAGPSESKRMKVLNDFSKNELDPKLNKNNNKKNKKWSVLEEEFMTGSKLKDWDKEDSDD